MKHNLTEYRQSRGEKVETFNLDSGHFANIAMENSKAHHLTHEGTVIYSLKQTAKRKYDEGETDSPEVFCLR